MSRLISMYEVDDHPELTYSGGPVQQLNCDVLVAGGGGSGLAAAIRASQLGAKVILVEKMERLGGNSFFAGGLLAPGSRYHREAGLPDKTEDYIKTNFKKHGYTLNSDLVRRYLNNAGRFYEWLGDLGFDTDNTRFVMDAVVMVKERTEQGPLNHPAYGPGLMGSNVTGLLSSHLEPQGVTCLMSSKVEKLLTKDGTVCSALVQGQEKSYRIDAKAVILSTGGFGGNVEMLRRFLPEYFGSDNYFSHYCMLSTTGDGITMAEEIGAEVGKNISVGVEAINHIPGAYSVQCATKCPRGVIVNRKGKRFIPEDDTANGLKVMDMQPDGIAFYLFRESGMEALFEEAKTKPNYGDRIPTWEEFLGDVEREVQDGKILRGQTVQELEKQLGCEEGALMDTLDEYERFCSQSHDDAFYKFPEYLIPLGDGPIYACKLYRKFDVTMGGVSINEKLQVLRPDQTPIPGLYATGDVASNWMGTDYGPLFSSFAWAMNSGYLSGEEATAFAKA